MQFMRIQPRREFLGTSLALLWADRALAADDSPRIPLGFSLYNMKSLSLADGIAACAKIGYDCTELPLMADWPGDSAKLAGEQIKAIRETLATNKIALAALMENLPLLDDAKQQNNLARVRRAGELAHELAPDAPPVIETVLGGSPTKWEDVKQTMVKRLREWAKVAEATRSVIAIKGHVNNAAHLPEHV
ncbi:MAG TPA: TIM barrel protein, partial [Pirellulaceae bacterium]|nr:TIM barrel protein [Pirellulaceae bacterium]